MHYRGDKDSNLTAAESLRQVTWNGTTKQLWQNVIQKAPIDSECLQSSGLPFPVSATSVHVSENSNSTSLGKLAKLCQTYQKLLKLSLDRIAI